MAFKFPDDFQTYDLILVDSQQDSYRVLEAFQKAGWTWPDGDLPLDFIPSDAVGISIRSKPKRKVGYLRACFANDDDRPTYRHTYELYEVFPEDTSEDDFASVDLSKFL